jgi:diaminopimelate epimerase
VAKVEFRKYEGTANDFLLVDLRDQGRAEDFDPATVARLCDRHRGVGGDGVLLVLPARGGAGARMVVLNADGSRPEMCGNGLRCVALHLARGLAPGELARADRNVVVETDAGERTCRIEIGAAGDAHVTVDMGRIHVERTIEVPFRGRSIPLVAVDAGNPHAVCFAGLEEDELDPLGIELQRSTWWPKGVNLERVVERARARFEVTVFERGVGRTLACGTGACAVAAAIVARGAARAGDPLEIVLPGGTLEIVVDGGGRASMRGPARAVFDGVVDLPFASFTSR